VLDNGKKTYSKFIYRVVTSALSAVTSAEKKSPHVLRHTYATHLLNHGAGIQAIKELLGHSSLASTQVYTHNNIEELKKTYRKSHPRS
jgi:integrase/recombinase XerC